MSALLLRVSDLPLSGFTAGGSQPVTTPTATGSAVAFTSSDHTRVLGDTVVLYADAAAATVAAASAQAAAAASLHVVVSRASTIGTGGHLYAGTTQAGTRASCVIVFTEGRSMVTMEFDGPAGDTVPAATLEGIARRQDQVLQAGLI